MQEKDNILAQYDIPCEIGEVVSTNEFLYRDYGAFSMCWPSIAFGDIHGNVYIGNGYAMGDIRPIPMFASKEFKN